MGGPVFVDQKWSRVHFWHAKSGLVGPLFAGTTFGMTDPSTQESPYLACKFLNLRLGEDNNREFLFLTTLTSTTHHDLFTKRSTTRTGKVKLQNTPCYEIEVTEKKCIELYLSMLVVLFFQTTPLHNIITSTCKSGQNNFIFALCTVDILLHT